MLISLAVLIVAIMAILWLGWAVVKTYWPSAATSEIGQGIELVSDTTQDWTALAALKAIRYADEVQESPDALYACDVLEAVFYDRAIPTRTGTVTIAPAPVAAPVVTPATTPVVAPAVAPVVTPATADNADEIIYHPKA